MNTKAPMFIGMHKNHMRDWAKLKEQLFFEKYGRFANKEAICGRTSKSDQSTLLDFLPNEKTVESVYKDFLHSEQEAVNASNIISQTRFKK
jgi:hypothetical protein